MLSYYKNELVKCDPLTKEDECKIKESLVKLKKGKIKLTDKKLKEFSDKIIKSCLRLAFKKASKYVNKDVSFEDLVGAANEGLVQAYLHYKPEYSVKFSNYACFWIRQFIFAELKKDKIRLPARDVSLRARLAVCQDSKLTDKEILGKLGVTEKKLKQLRNSPYCEVSLDSKNAPDNDNGEGSSLLDNLSSGEDDPLELFTEREYCNNVKNAVMKKLKGRDRKLISMRFGLGCDFRSLSEVADELTISKERVRQEQDRILKKLKTAPEIRRLADL